MVSFYFIRVLILLDFSYLVLNQITDSFRTTTTTTRPHNTTFDVNCDKVLKKPRFKNELVLGKTWRVYFAWNTNLGDLCPDITFRNTNPLLINNVRTQMQWYLKTQLDWTTAHLYMTISGLHHVLLVTDKEEAVGSFRQVLHVVNESMKFNATPKSIPLNRMAINLILDRRYLIVSDCEIGYILLSGRKNEPPDWTEISTVALSLDFGDGKPVCEHKVDEDSDSTFT